MAYKKPLNTKNKKKNIKKNKKQQEKHKQKITTLKLRNETKQRLEKLREHQRESYDEIIRKILYVLNILKIDPEKASGILAKIDELRIKMLQQEQVKAS